MYILECGTKLEHVSLIVSLFFVFVKSLKNYFPQKWGVYWAKPKSGVKTKICHNYDYYN